MNNKKCNSKPCKILMAILLAAIVFSLLSTQKMMNEWKRAQTINEVNNYAVIIGNLNKPALNFDIYEKVQDTLGALSDIKNIRQACLYDTGTITGENIHSNVGRYQDKTTPPASECPSELKEYTLVTDGQIKVMKAIASEGKIIGYIYIESIE